MTLRFVRIDPTLPQQVLDLSSIGFSAGDMIDVVPTGSYAYNLRGIENGTGLTFSYNNLTYMNHTTISLDVTNGTKLTVNTGDSYYADNIDADGNYGLLLGRPDVVDTPDQAGTVLFPTDGLSHFVSSTAVNALDASQTSRNIFIDARGYGASVSTDSSSKLVLDAIPAKVILGAGNDTIITASSSFSPQQTIDAGAGNDTVIVQASLSDFDLLSSGQSLAKIATSEGSLEIKNVEHLIFYDGAMDLSGGLTDNLYYYFTNADVYAAGIDPATHYEQYGWHEGRNPNAEFSTTGYLAANADVRAAGLNPLTHYDQYGFKDGRDPSANFDSELYLARNPDVKAAGLDPLAHYLQYGQAEGRQTYAAIGKAGDLNTHPGFDAEYYLLSNTDVAKAAIATGGDSFAFAYQHYETYGWHEGRNPNAVFDTKGYLAAYGDVKAANIDPLAHYDNYGWHEDRDPSANFDTKAYESHYTDVANAGLDPMLHYLQYGALEGRSTFNDGHFG